MSQPLASRRPSAAAAIYLSSWLIPLFVAGHTWSEHSRRVDVLTNGREVAGEVTEAARQSSGRLSTCEVDYAFELDGTYASATSFGCRLMERFPEGSPVRIRVDPKDQRGAMIVGDSTWPIYWPLSAAVILVWLAYGWAWFWPVRDDRRRRRRKSKKAA